MGGKYQYDSRWLTLPHTIPLPPRCRHSLFSVLRTLEGQGFMTDSHCLRWFLLMGIHFVFYRYGPFPSSPATDHFLETILDAVLEKSCRTEVALECFLLDWNLQWNFLGEGYKEIDISITIMDNYNFFLPLINTVAMNILIIISVSVPLIISLMITGMVALSKKQKLTYYFYISIFINPTTRSWVRSNYCMPERSVPVKAKIGLKFVRCDLQVPWPHLTIDQITQTSQYNKKQK